MMEGLSCSGHGPQNPGFGVAGESGPDFASLLKRQGLYPHASAVAHSGPVSAAAREAETHATTILAFKFAGGVLMAGDRRATAGNTVVYDRADKVLEIDRHSLMAIAGVPATAWEMARVLEHSFQFYRRTQLQEMSHDGKVRALSKLLRDNFGFVMQGVGIVVPIFATYDHAAQTARLYFYDTFVAGSSPSGVPDTPSLPPTFSFFTRFFRTLPTNSTIATSALSPLRQPRRIMRV